MRYDSSVPNIIIVSNEPIKILVDDRNFDFQANIGDQGYSVRLPAGEHTAKIYTQSNGTQALKLTSFIISGLIVFFGILAGLLLSSLYIRTSLKKSRASA